MGTKLGSTNDWHIDANGSLQPTLGSDAPEEVPTPRELKETAATLVQMEAELAAREAELKKREEELERRTSRGRSGGGN